MELLSKWLEEWETHSIFLFILILPMIVVHGWREGLTRGKKCLSRLAFWGRPSKTADDLIWNNRFFWSSHTNNSMGTRPICLNIFSLLAGLPACREYHIIRTETIFRFCFILTRQKVLVGSSYHISTDSLAFSPFFVSFLLHIFFIGF